MKAIPKLNLGQNPNHCEEGSLMFANNIKANIDGSISSDYGYKNIDVLKDYNIVGHIVGLNNTIYFLCYDDETKNSNIIQYNETTQTITEIKSGWKYNHGSITGCVTTNTSGEIILTIAEKSTTDNILIPLKHINLSYCRKTDDESIYTQTPKIPHTNLILTDTYAKTIPNGVYVFFIRYKIRDNVYTGWHLCSRPIFGGTSTKTNTLQGGLKYIDIHKDSAKSFIFGVTHVQDTNSITSYKSFQLGFIISHDDAIDARIWKEFDINTINIYFDYDDIKEGNIDDFLETTYGIYNVGNVTVFKNQLYISNYIESDLNPNHAKEMIDGISVNVKHSDVNGDGTSFLHNSMTLNGTVLSYNNTKGYYDKTENGNPISSLITSPYMFDYDISNFYKGESLEKEKIVRCDVEWKSENNPDLATIHNIYNECYNRAIFGYPYDPNLGDGRLGIKEAYNVGNLWLFDRNTENIHPWDTLGFTFIYGSTSNRDVNTFNDCRNGVFEFNRYSKNWGVEGNSSIARQYWPSRDMGFVNDAKDFIKNNIKEEIDNKSRLIYCYLELNSGAKIYKIGYYDYMEKDTYVGNTDDYNYGFSNAHTRSLTHIIKNKIQTLVFNAIKSYVVGIDESGNLIFYIDGDYIRINSIIANFKAIKFKTDIEEITNETTTFLYRYSTNATITTYSSICTFNFKTGYVTINNNANSKDNKQHSTLMPFSKYKVYAHFVNDYGVVSNGVYIDTITTDKANSDFDILSLTYSINKQINYKSFFLSLTNVGDYVMEGFAYSKRNNTNILHCLEIDSMLYNINDNIIVKDSDGNILTTNAKYHSSGDSNPVLAFGNCGYVSWEGSYYGNSKLYIIIERNTSDIENPVLHKCSAYLSTKITNNANVVDGFYGSYFCAIKKPSFDLSSSCYVSGRDVYSAKRSTALSLSGFNNYIQIQDSSTYYVRSNYNLNYLSLTDDISDQIFSIGSASSNLKQVAKVINSAILSFIYELKGMYKDFRNKTFREWYNKTKIKFDNTIRTSTVLSDETSNNSVFKFIATDYYNVPTDRGIITSLFSIGNNIFIHTKGSLYKFDASQNIMASDTDIVLKESDPFVNGITQICDSQYGYAGISDKCSSCVTFDSYVFYDKESKHIFAYGGQSQLQTIDDDIYEFIKILNITNCRIIHDESNNRLLFNFDIDNSKQFTISYNYKLKHFVSLHDLTLKKSFTSKSKCYSYNNRLISLFDKLDTYNDDIRYGDATFIGNVIPSFNNTTDLPNKGSFISVLLFPMESKRTALDSVQYVAKINDKFINSNDDFIKLNFNQINRVNPIKSLFITTDECQSNSVFSDTKNGLDINDYKNVRYELGFWILNYFRNILDSKNKLNYRNQPGTNIQTKDGLVSRIPNTDNYSLVYGKYFILTFIFKDSTDISFENVTINDSKY